MAYETEEEKKVIYNTLMIEANSIHYQQSLGGNTAVKVGSLFESIINRLNTVDESKTPEEISDDLINHGDLINKLINADLVNALYKTEGIVGSIQLGDSINALKPNENGLLTINVATQSEYGVLKLMNSLTADVDGFAITPNAVKTAIDNLNENLQEQINTLTSTDENLQEQINTLTSTDENLQQQISALSLVDKNLQNKIDTLASNSEKMPTVTNINGLDVSKQYAFKPNADGSIKNGTFIEFTGGGTSGTANAVINVKDGSEIKFWTGTLNEYNSVTSKDNNVAYIITDDEKINVLGTTLDGLSTSNKDSINNSDTIISGFGKLQGQISQIKSDIDPIPSGYTTAYGRSEAGSSTSVDIVIGKVVDGVYDGSQVGNIKFWRGTEEAYNLLNPKDNDFLYIITD